MPKDFHVIFNILDCPFRFEDLFWTFWLTIVLAPLVFALGIYFRRKKNLLSLGVASSIFFLFVGATSLRSYYERQNDYHHLRDALNHSEVETIEGVVRGFFPASRRTAASFYVSNVLFRCWSKGLQNGFNSDDLIHNGEYVRIKYVAHPAHNDMVQFETADPDIYSQTNKLNGK